MHRFCVHVHCLPRVLCVTLGRVFHPHAANVAKSFRQVSPDDALYLSGHCYKLLAAIQHIGTTPRSGHYVTWVRVSGGAVIYDDGIMQSCENEELPDEILSNGVLFVYILQPVSRSALPILASSSGVGIWLNETDRAAFNGFARSELFGTSELVPAAAPERSPAPAISLDANGNASIQPAEQISDASDDSGEEKDEDAPDSDGDHVGEADLEDGIYLSATDDSLATFDSHVDGLLNIFVKRESFEDCCEYLIKLPNVAPAVARLGPRSLLAKFQKVLAQVRNCDTNSADAIRFTVPYWECHNYRFCVLVAAVGRCWGLPPVFYLDCFRAAMFSLMHKEAHVATSGFRVKHRPWTCGVGDTGTGKSHPTGQICDVVEEVCVAEPNYAVGTSDDNFHVLATRTYSALEDKMRDTKGYALLLCGEGSQQLAKSYPAKGEWTDGSGLMFDRMMDAATGKQFGGETKKTARQERPRRSKVANKHTNLDLVLVIQDSVFADWWAVAESKVHEGLAARFLFSFARGREAGPLKFKNFFEKIYRPSMKKALQTILVTFSAKNPIEDGSNAVGVYKFTDANERLFKNVRVVCKAAEGETAAHRRKFVAGLNKCGYWVPLVGWENAILEEVMNYILLPSDPLQDESATNTQFVCKPTIRYGAMAGAINFMWARYSFGQVPKLESLASSTAKMIVLCIV